MQEFKSKQFEDSQAADKKLELHIGRFSLSYADTALVLNFFANRTDGKVSIPTMTSFFRDQRFPANWHRRSPNKSSLTESLSYSPNGVYVPDSADTIDPCAFYDYLAGDNLPGVLSNTTGLLKRNVDFLLDAIHAVFPQCPAVLLAELQMSRLTAKLIRL
ncbi:hypothetical protein FPV67DRAFT_1501875 [Lyophyllum atratum]|nr:hypothetical protein FPV67DRAFT_1501875 [Lyophyllum atratum]